MKTRTTNVPEGTGEVGGKAMSARVKKRHFTVRPVTVVAVVTAICALLNPRMGSAQIDMGVVTIIQNDIAVDIVLVAEPVESCQDAE